MDINHRLEAVEQSSSVYAHQAEKFHAEATQLSSLLERSFLEAEQFINNRMQILASKTFDVNQKLESEKTLLLATRSKLDTTLNELTKCHQEAMRLQNNIDNRFRLMINTAKGRLEQVERLKNKMIRYENSFEITSPISEDAEVILSKSSQSTTQKFQDELKRVTEQLKNLVDLSKESRNETHILHGQYDTDVNRQVAALMRHDKTEREQMSAIIEHKQCLMREIDWIQQQKRLIDNFISKTAPTIEECVCDCSSATNNHQTIR